MADTPAKEPAKESPKPEPKKSVSLEDLSHDPTLIDGLTPEEAQDLYEEAETEGIRPAGTVLQELYAKSQVDNTPATKQEQEDAAAAANGQAQAQ